MIVQIYEISNPAEARKIAKLGADHVGVLVGKGEYPRELSLERTKEIFKSLPKGIKGVALSLAQDLKEIIELVEKTNPDILHLGTMPENLSPEDVKKIKKRLPKNIFKKRR